MVNFQVSSLTYIPFINKVNTVVYSVDLADYLQNIQETNTSYFLSGSRGYQRSSSLLINAVNKSDSGVYRCHGQNERGTTTTALQLDVRGEW